MPEKQQNQGITQLELELQRTIKQSKIYMLGTLTGMCLGATSTALGIHIQGMLANRELFVDKPVALLIGAIFLIMYIRDRGLKKITTLKHPS